MKVFVSWSGQHSHAIALALRDWLPSVLQHLRPWVSSEDIAKGAGWWSELDNELTPATHGIICVTPESVSSPWLNFEAGALAKSADTKHVYVLLSGLSPTDLTGPLTFFQATQLSEKADVLKLLADMNADSPSPVPSGILERAFEREWADLANTISAIRPNRIPEAEGTARTERELIEETLSMVRQMARTLNADADTITDLSAAILDEPPIRSRLGNLSPGDFVRHAEFGVGSVQQVEGQGDKRVLHIDFRAGVGRKRVLARYAPLEQVVRVRSAQGDIYRVVTDTSSPNF